VATANNVTAERQEAYPFKAEALHACEVYYIPSFVFFLTFAIDTASPDDATELSFKKGEVLDILTKSEQWWEARKLDGTKGSKSSSHFLGVTFHSNCRSFHSRPL
jgi:hypothetical protein